MKHTVTLKKLASLCFVAVFAVFNFFNHPTAACAMTNSVASTVVLEQTVAPQNCCCDSGDCCARRNSDCSASPMDKVLPASLKLTVGLRLLPVLASGFLTCGYSEQACTTSQSLKLNSGNSSINPSKLYLVNRTLLI